jgi:hypothetical protein
MPEINGHINNALLLLDSVLEQIETGFVRCEHCGEQEDTKTLDFVSEIKAVRNELLKAIS